MKSRLEAQLEESTSMMESACQQLDSDDSFMGFCKGTAEGINGMLHGFKGFTPDKIAEAAVIELFNWVRNR